ncbi:MAG: bifunctional 2-polyprenyl-6-hydroxyphenol methylase/3-demethylubiquinol 3-O-methyltransferase UbiG [Alphaproteobacteria bacterium]|jgi:2-polyprenyl-6-hydroxyphenyl methylase/3-demethylubiquinone-9 3-methyltransferase|nr:bifunctional 2-polyprenyl-6-hydroxyphenol methylase/3-demethylubiquinol 3-O-methyltransferase UbiG [Alphaproteobacteria bacterium]
MTDRASVDHGEIARFDRLAEAWWDPEGKFRQLHKMNPVRIGYIRERVAAHFGRADGGTTPLAGLSLVDVGCGGGLLTEPMARLGAATTGLDPSSEAIAVAARHAELLGLDIAYRNETAERVAATGESFDVVLSLETVEHVSNPDSFLQALAHLVRPGGLVILSTLNRNARSFTLGIVAAEYVLGWVARGTHDWRKFLKPHELARGLRRTGLTITDVTGLVYDPRHAGWRLDPRDLGINYLMTAAAR